METQRDYNRLMDMAMLAGELMQESGAETYRVEETINRILQTSGLRTSESFALSTGIVATLADPSIETITVVRRVNVRQNNLGRIHWVNSVSRDYCGGRITLEEAYRRLLETRGEVPYQPRLVYGARVAAVAFFALVFGGGPWELLGTLLVCPMMMAAIWLGERLRLHDMLRTIFSAFSIGISGLWICENLLTKADLDLVIISSIMLLVPGALFTNAIRDILYGDYSSGTSRMVESILVAVSVAIGVVLAFLVYGGAA